MNKQISIPKLDPKRDKYSKYIEKHTYEELSLVVYAWLFWDKKESSHRDLDLKIFGIEPKRRHGGWETFGILHYYGLHGKFSSIFHKFDNNSAINLLEESNQDFGQIIEFINYQNEGGENKIFDSLYEVCTKKKLEFATNYQQKLRLMEDLDVNSRTSITRKEQALLSAYLFGSNMVDECCMCHRVLPVNLLVTGHIKPRSECNDAEKKDLNNVMPICTLGCDKLFEDGYIYVNEIGNILKSSVKKIPVDLREFIENLIGKQCLSFNKENLKYFNFKKKKENN